MHGLQCHLFSIPSSPETCHRFLAAPSQEVWRGCWPRPLPPASLSLKSPTCYFPSLSSNALDEEGGAASIGQRWFRIRSYNHPPTRDSLTSRHVPAAAVALQGPTLCPCRLRLRPESSPLKVKGNVTLPLAAQAKSSGPTKIQSETLWSPGAGLKFRCFSELVPHGGPGTGQWLSAVPRTACWDRWAPASLWHGRGWGPSSARMEGWLSHHIAI